MVEKATIPDVTEGSLVHAVAQPALSNLPDREEFLFLVGQIEQAENEVKQANARKKKVRQHAMNRGINLEDADRARKERDKKDSTTLESLKRYRQYCQYLNLPIGHQISFSDSPAVAEPQMDLTERARSEGYELGIRGKNPDDQKWKPGTPEASDHLDGWYAGQAVLKHKIQPFNDEIAAADRAEAKAKQAKADKAAAATGEKSDGDATTEPEEMFGVPDVLKGTA